MIRTHTHKLNYFSGGHDGLLFNLEDDPGEQVNLWHEPQARNRRRELSETLLDWLYQSRYRHRELFIDAR